MSRDRVNHTICERHAAYQFHQRGLSLIELMIGLLIGLILLGGVLQTLLASKEAASARQSMATVTENARFLFDFMARDLRMVGRGFGASSVPASYSGKTLTSEYYLPASGGGNDHIMTIFAFSNNEIKYARSVNGASYTLQTLVDQVESFEVAFGSIASDSSSTISYTAYDAEPSSWSKVIAIRTRVSFQDVSAGDFSIDTASRPLVSTVALRNRIATLSNN